MNDETDRTALQALRWDRLLAIEVAILALTAIVCTQIVGVRWPDYPFAWLAAAFSFRAVFAVSLLSLIPSKKFGSAVFGLLIFGLVLASFWYVGSVRVFQVQGRALKLDELFFWLSETGRIQVVLGLLASWLGLAVAAAIIGGVLGMSHLVRRLPAMLVAIGAIGPGMFAVVLGYSLVTEERQDNMAEDDFLYNLAAQWVQPVSAPWSPPHRIGKKSQPINLEAARQITSKAWSPFWAEGPAEPLADLASRYVGRNIVLILMESQRASDTGVLGEGAFNHKPTTPKLDELSRSALLFSRYDSAGSGTHTALWAIFTGLPATQRGMQPVARAPESSQVGVVPKLRKLGYRVDALRSASPANQNWAKIFAAADARYWVEQSEIPRDRRHWNVWGMQDDQLFDIAFRRYKAALDSKKPYFLTVLTASNHEPYEYPPLPTGEQLPKDYTGGQRFADFCMGAFVERLRALPQEEQPVIFVVADHSHIVGIYEHELHEWSVETTRIPGIMLLPDDRLAGQRFDGKFIHEDLLDLLHMMVAPEGAPVSDKFKTKHRVVTLTREARILYTDQTYYHMAFNKFYAFQSTWKVVPITAPPDLPLLYAAQDEVERQLRALWGDGEVDPRPRDARPPVPSTIANARSSTTSTVAR